MARKSLYRYSDDELSLLVFNTEYLYTQRHNKGFIRLLAGIYQYTRMQLAILKTDLADDLQQIQYGDKVIDCANGEGL